MTGLFHADAWCRWVEGGLVLACGDGGVWGGLCMAVWLVNKVVVSGGEWVRCCMVV